MTLLNQEMFDLVDDVFRISNEKLLSLTSFPDGTAILTSLTELRPICQDVQTRLMDESLIVKRSQVFEFRTLLGKFEKTTSITFLPDLVSILHFLKITGTPDENAEVDDHEEPEEGGVASSDNNNDDNNPS
ncbi:MAG: hypothetical protein MRY78_17825 [Saprospiraceae bacterium]|nr:hypothetical protein [Saprospiraceae bacterium]